MSARKLPDFQPDRDRAINRWVCADWLCGPLRPNNKPGGSPCFESVRRCQKNDLKADKNWFFVFFFVFLGYKVVCPAVFNGVVVTPQLLYIQNIARSNQICTPQ